MSRADPLSRLFACADERPDHPAVVEGERATDYGEFAALVRRLAGALVQAGPQPRVLIHLTQGLEAYASMFASLMAGGCYAPTNLTAPPARQQRVAEAFEPNAIVATGATLPSLGESIGPASVIDPGRLSGEPLDAPAAPGILAYIMFTSGSTGEPKGVMIPRDALAHYTGWAIEAMAVTQEDRFSQHPNIAFDLSVLDIYGALCAGATLYPLAGPRDRMLPADAIRRHGLTIWNSVPSVVDLMTQAGGITPVSFKSLRLMTFCGEPLLPAHLDAIFAARPDLAVHNTYGPTEATVSCTLLRLTSGNYRNASRSSVALGQAIPGMGLHLVAGDDGDQVGDEGEIVLTGAQLARGYWRNEAATGAAFRELKLETGSVPAYRTGDWAVRASDGHVFFAGRIDRQVKVRGHRIELGEIDVALRALGAGAAYSVMADGRIHSFVEVDDGTDLDALRGQLGTRLSEHQIPAVLHQIARLPRNLNDKIDVAQLATMIGEHG